MLQLRNPHAAAAALATRPRDVTEIRLPPGRPSEGWQQVAEVARGQGIAIHTELASSPTRLSRSDKFERTSVASAMVREKTGVSLEQLFEQPQAGQLWLALDCLQDPHNVGAIFRSAAFFGVRGILLTKDRSAPLTGTVYDVASGGVEHVPFHQASNLAAALKGSKEAGIWVLGSSEHASRDIQAISRDRPWILVIGNEEQGLRRLSLDLCDEVCRITPRGAVGSLNASVAAGILISALSPHGD